MTERLYPRRIESGIWKGPDIAVAEDVVIGSNSEAQVPIVVTQDHVPKPSSGYPWFIDSFLLNRDGPYPSVRSRYAQVGLNIEDRVIGQIGNWILRNVPFMNPINHPFTNHTEPSPVNKILPNITVRNHQSAPVGFDKSTKLFRFFKESYGSFLEGDELVDAVKEELIEVKGEFFGDWVYSSGPVRGSSQNRPNGMFIRINPQNRRWIPPHPENKPIHIPDSDDKYRDMIDSILKPIPEEKYKTILWIGETIKVTLKSPIDAILDPVAIRGIGTDRDILDQTTWGTQINSRLIDGGKTDWAIRTEIISPTSEDRIPHFVRLRFVKGTR